MRFFRKKSYIVNRKSSGVALVVTLILLAVTLVMAVAFLAVSRRERGSVTTQTDTTTAKQASDAALALAEAQIVSDIYISTNPYVSRLYVTTNYASSYGFATGSANPTNVNYNGEEIPPGTPLSQADFVQNIANLYYSPAPPVYATNLVRHTNELQFYLDLNRNGLYDSNGLVTNLDVNFKGLGTTNLEVGDPEWIGVLEHPDAPHGPNNRFIARYCFIAVPADSLDLNSIHNQVIDTPASAPSPGSSLAVYFNTQDAYFRDQGVGTWEMNLAAFLADVNADRWGQVIGTPANGNNTYYFYDYNPTPPPHYSEGLAFSDAQALIAWRYANNYYSLDTPDNIFGNPAGFVFANNGIDGFGLQRQITFDTNFFNFNAAAPWPGANNPNNFFSSPSELFDTNRSSIPFVTSLIDVGSSNATYDRYTFYRLLSQLGTDSQPESGRLNVNYSNAVVGCDFNGVMTNFSFVPGLETNCLPWQPQTFFTAAANLLLHAYTTEWYESGPSNYLQTYYGITTPNYLGLSGVGVTNVQYYPLNASFTGQTNQIPDFGVTNIPVLVNNQFVYTPAVNRLLQLAANIYDASTNISSSTAILNLRSGVNGMSNYPSIFRPVFWVTNEFSYAYNQNFTNIYIKGFTYTPYATNGIGDAIFDLPVELTALPQGLTQTNVWGVPWILGAKKGFPSLDKAEIESSVFVERLLQFNRNTNGATGSTFPYGRNYTTNQMFIMGISNFFGTVDANTYSENYGSGVSVVARDSLQMGMVMTNENKNSASVFNAFFSSQTNVLSPWLAHSNTMLLGTNIFQYFLTAAGNSVYGFNYPNYSVPMLLNTGNIIWTTNASFAYYDTPRPVSFPSLPGYFFTGPCFIPGYLDPSNFLDSGTPPMSQMFFSMTNRMQVFMVDSAGGILDYVQLGGMSSTVNINTNIADESQYPQGSPNLATYQQGLWSTNYYAGSTPYGVYLQFLVSTENKAVPVPPDGDNGGNWATTQVPGTMDTGPAAQQAFCAAFFSPENRAPYNNAIGGYVSNTQNSIQAPFTPIRVATQKFVYEANDPLVHYLASDMNDHSSSTNTLLKDQPILSKLSSPNDRYAPWGYLGLSWPGSVYYDGNPFNMAYKDPLVRGSDNWDFPTNKYPTIGWLGRVHRGTPWQTIYLKSTNLLQYVYQVPNSGTAPSGLYTWQLWSGDQNAYDAVNAAPVQDRILFDLFTATPYENATRGQLSINVGAADPDNNLAGLAAWSALLSGVVVLSNNIPNTTLGVSRAQAQAPITNQFWPGSTALTIQPAGLSGFNSPLGQIVQSINLTRRNFINIDSLTNVFEHVGDILSVPMLSDASPFLSITDDVPTFLAGNHMAQITNGISDEMYEWLPQQVMSLLTVSGRPQSPPRYVVYCYGQTLKPAANGIVSSGTFFGLCTNYQVMAEFGARAVIRVVNAPTPANPGAQPHAVIEQYNPLPPD